MKTEKRGHLHKRIDRVLEAYGISAVDFCNVAGIPIDTDEEYQREIDNIRISRLTEGILRRFENIAAKHCALGGTDVGLKDVGDVLKMKMRSVFIAIEYLEEYWSDLGRIERQALYGREGKI